MAIPPRPNTGPITRARRFRAALSGDLPAEALATTERERLVRQLHTAGWTDAEIATHTRMTTYTTGRIRGRLGLAARPTMKGAAA